MNKTINLFNFKSFLLVAFCLFTVSNVFATSASEKNYQIVVKNLSQKLQNDLGNNNVRLKLTNVEEYKISKTEIGLTGSGDCIVANDNQMPIKFEVKLNTVNQSVSEIVYDFVENPAAYAPTSTEDVLMKELMKQIKNDYKTENIVIAIDAVEDVGSEKFLGVGEVRIGDLMWNKIKFDVVLDAETKRANKIVYKLEK
jgi:hypothetical protein